MSSLVRAHDVCLYFSSTDIELLYQYFVAEGQQLHPPVIRLRLESDLSEKSGWLWIVFSQAYLRPDHATLPPLRKCDVRHIMHPLFGNVMYVTPFPRFSAAILTQQIFKTMSKTIFITGASKGFGRLWAEVLAAAAAQRR